MRVERFCLRFCFHRLTEALAHFGGGGFGEGNDEQFVERRVIAGETVEAAFDEGFGFARAGAGHDENVAARDDRATLRWREQINFGGRGFQAAKTLAADDTACHAEMK